MLVLSSSASTNTNSTTRNDKNHRQKQQRRMTSARRPHHSHVSHTEYCSCQFISSPSLLLHGFHSEALVRRDSSQDLWAQPWPRAPGSATSAPIRPTQLRRRWMAHAGSRERRTCGSQHALAHPVRCHRLSWSDGMLAFATHMSVFALYGHCDTPVRQAASPLSCRGEDSAVAGRSNSTPAPG